jgi:hypothetical protein
MTEAISLKIRGLLRRSFLTSRNDDSQPWVFVQPLIRIAEASVFGLTHNPTYAMFDDRFETFEFCHQ